MGNIIVYTQDEFFIKSVFNIKKKKIEQYYVFRKKNVVYM